MRSACLALAAIACVCLAPAAVRAGNDLLIADFEGRDYGLWKAEGRAFGVGPAHGAFPRQMKVEGFVGRGLVNSFLHGDGSRGKLSSPEFTVQRQFITFLIGGGHHPGKTCVNLLVEGRVVRTMTGPNKVPGGTERLDPAYWDVQDLAGKKARLEIVDEIGGSWGHINIDHIVQTDRRPPVMTADQAQALNIQQRYVLLPIKRGAAKRNVALLVDDQLVQDYTIELAEGASDDAANVDLRPWLGKKAVLRVDRMSDQSQFFQHIAQADAPRLPAGLYQEKLRPQFHFTPRTNWTNDPNGLVYYQGEYHLFFQHNPYGLPWGNMTWGHAVSPDLVHWKQLDNALEPDRLGTIFSGSAVIDWDNTAGFQTGSEKTLVCIYTSAGGTSLLSKGVKSSQSIAYSNDRGRTWTKYARNPVLPHIIGGNRDPKVIWHAPTKRWIMALFLDKSDFGLFSSPNLKQWTQLQTVTMSGSSECPDFFPLAVDSDAQHTKWVLTSAKGDYLVGSFDGKQFVSETGPHPLRWGGNYYAVQSYSDIPAADGRRIQIAWMNGGRYPGMPFNQQMNFPSTLTLHRTPEGLRMRRYPVREIEVLRTRTHRWSDLALAEGPNPLAHATGELFDLEAQIEPGSAQAVELTVFGQKLRYEVADQKLLAGGAKLPVEPLAGRIKLRVLIDRATIDAFANDGRTAICYNFLPSEGSAPLELKAVGGSARLVSLEVHELKSAWGR
jgi:sucrose-6-phosphate hydrolase SacC (GH32 family)